MYKKILTFIEIIILASLVLAVPTNTVEQELVVTVLPMKVAYIFKNDMKIDHNVINALEELNLEVDLIQEDTLPINLTEYRLIYVGDERFTNIENIPINKKPTIISNYYYGYDSGITDRAGISQLGSTAPLTVNINGTSVQVYTEAFLRARLAVPYYFLNNRNKLSSLTQIAATKKTSSGTLGDVISYATPGTTLTNGETVEENICFFGIVKSEFWTPDAKNLFKNCARFATGL